jgi:cation:H+ antiporter
VLLAGAEPEELVTAALASASDRPGLAVGDAVGANVTMLTAALGLAALARPLPVGAQVRRYAAGAVLAGGLALLALLDGRVGRLEGAGLLAAYAALVALVWWRERTPPAIGELAERDDDRDDGSRRPALALALAVLGLAVMTAGGVAAVEGAERLVGALGRTDTEVGLTVLALATTAELFALVAAAVRRGVEEVAVAAVLGSTAYNATATLGTAALVQPLASVSAVPAAALAAVLPLAAVAAGTRGRLGRSAGAGLLTSYVVFDRPGLLSPWRPPQPHARARMAGGRGRRGCRVLPPGGLSHPEVVPPAPAGGRIPAWGAPPPDVAVLAPRRRHAIRRCARAQNSLLLVSALRGSRRGRLVAVAGHRADWRCPSSHMLLLPLVRWVLGRLGRKAVVPGSTTWQTPWTATANLGS